MADKSLDERKDEISGWVDEYVAKVNAESDSDGAGGDDDSSGAEAVSDSDDEDEEEEDDEPAKPKAKMTVKTKSGAAAPKQLAKVQQKSMTKQQFDRIASTLSVDVRAQLWPCAGRLSWRKID